MDNELTRRVIITSDLRTVASLRDRLSQSGITTSDANGKQPAELGFSDLAEAITVLVGSGGALAAFCKTVADVVKEKKQKVTLKRGDETYQFENMTADDISKILSASPPVGSTGDEMLVAIENTDQEREDVHP